MVTGGHRPRIWDAASGQPLLTLSDPPGRSEQFRSLRFLANGDLLAANDNGSLYVFGASGELNGAGARR